jgi:Zn finger protein HypA/HybF involved in hydrogenase expression
MDNFTILQIMRICRRCKEPYLKWLNPAECPQCKVKSYRLLDDQRIKEEIRREIFG